MSKNKRLGLRLRAFYNHDVRNFKLTSYGT